MRTGSTIVLELLYCSREGEAMLGYSFGIGVTFTLWCCSGFGTGTPTMGPLRLVLVEVPSGVRARPFAAVFGFA